jgi:hypothetical protein
MEYLYYQLHVSAFYIGHHQVYLKLIEILYNLNGVLGRGVGAGTRSRFTIVSGMESEFGMDFMPPTIVKGDLVPPPRPPEHTVQIV